MMATLAAHSRLCCGLQRSSSILMQKRYNVRESIHRYVEPDKFKKHLLAASEPYFKKKYILPSDSCKGNAPKIHDQEPLQRIYVEELVEAIKANDFVLFIQHNYTPHQVERVHKNTLIKSGGQFYSHRNVVYKEVFANMGLDRVQHLFITRNSLVLGKFDCLSTCVKALRRMPQFILLAGCIENELYSHQELQIIGDNPSLDMNRANLTGLLETPAIELYQNLKQYVEMHPGEADPPEGAQVVEQTNPEAEK